MRQPVRIGTFLRAAEVCEKHSHPSLTWPTVHPIFGDVKDIHIHCFQGGRRPMSTTDAYTPADLRRDLAGPPWLRRTIDWLDDRGPWAWIGLMVAGFVIFWPVGFAVLAYMIWSKRMFGHRHHSGQRAMTCGSRRDRTESWRYARTAMRPSGNATFDAYKTETLRRLEEEQRAFEDFLARLREAKDKAEFDQFMEDRARKARSAGDAHEDAA